MASVDLEQVGFTTNNARSTCQELLRKLSALPGVSTVGMVDRAPYGGERGSLATDRVRLHEGVEVEHATVDVGPNYFKALGVPLIVGHEVSDADFASGRDVALVNETFVRTFWPDQLVLGWPIEKIRRRKFEIIGIVQDARLDNPAKAPRPTVFYSADICDALHPTFVLHAKHAETLIPGMWFVNGMDKKAFHFSSRFYYFSYGWEDRALQECNLSARPSLDCGCIHSWHSVLGAGSFCYWGAPQVRG